MDTFRKNNQGFGAIGILLGVLLIVVVGFSGYYVWHRQHTKSTPVTMSGAVSVRSKAISKAATKPTATSDLYAGWKTYTSPLKSGLSFKYPPDWDFTPNTTAPASDDLRGVENDSVLRSAQVQGTYGTVTNQYMCISIDEYSARGWDVSNWTLGKELASEQITLGGKAATLSTYAGDTPMQSELIVHNPNISSGNHFITTKNNFVVSIHAGFNICQQPGDGEGISNKQADFNQQPETDIAKKIIKSIQF